MRVGIIGLPQSGKSTVFAAVTEREVDPFAPPEPRQAVVRVPDDRLGVLEKLTNPEKVIHATMEFVDIPGFSLDTSKGQDDLRRMLPTMKQCECLAVVVRDFENPAVPAYRERVDPKSDLAAVWDELIFADLDTVTNRIERIEKALKRPAKTHEADKKEHALIERCREALESNKPLSTVLHTEEESRQVSSFAFLTQKPLVCVRNVSDEHAGESETLHAEHFEDSLTLSASIECEIATLEQEDRAVFMADLGVKQIARDRLVRTCYKACGLISFLTIGSDEVRAWTIPTGSTAVQAAAKVHTDLARGFIRAETISYDELMACGDMKAAKAAGKLRKEGKTYVVADGDILNILAGL